MCSPHNCALSCYWIQSFIAISILFAFNTTTNFNVYPYRAEYPAEKIDTFTNATALNEVRMRHDREDGEPNLPYHFNVHAAGFSDEEIASIKDDLYHGHLLHIFPAPAIHQEWSSCVTPEEFDEILHQHRLDGHAGKTGEPAGKMDIYLVQPNTTDGGELKEPRIWLGRHRHMWVEVPTLLHNELMMIVERIVDFFRQPAPDLKQLGITHTTESTVALQSPYTTYRITYALVNLAPEKVTVDWEAESIHKNLIRPFLDSLSVHEQNDGIVLQMDSDTQLVQHGEFPTVPLYSSTDSAYLIQESSIKRILNVNDWKFDSFLLSRREKSLKFITLVVPDQFCPLKLANNKGEVLPYHSFLIPDWGGVSVMCPEIGDSRHHLVTLKDMEQPCADFALQLRQFLGVSWSYAIPSDWHVLFPRGEVPKWEMDLWHRVLSTNNTQLAMFNLVSLRNLLDQLDQLPLYDSIAEYTRKATTLIYTTFKGGHYLRNMRRSQLALSYAEYSFFSDSLMAQLYFPQEHKLAVYAPFFLPLAVTLFVATIKGVKAWRKEAKARKAKEKEDKAKAEKEKKEKEEKEGAEGKKQANPKSKKSATEKKHD